MGHLINLYKLAYYFFIYSILGWLMESTINTIKQKTFINRGFLIGPYCPIYGVGMCTIYLCCFPIRNNLFLVFISGMFFSTLLEYITGYTMEKLFCARWWDYSRYKYNLHGHICLHISIFWGLLSMVFVTYIHPIIQSWLLEFSTHWSIIVLAGTSILFFIDCLYSTYIALELRSKLPALTELRLEIISILEQSKLYESAEEFKNHFELKKMSNRLSALIESLKEHLPQTSEPAKVQFHELLSTKLGNYHVQIKKLNLVEKRLLKAFPSLSSIKIKTIKNKLYKRGHKK